MEIWVAAERGTTDDDAGRQMAGQYFLRKTQTPTFSPPSHEFPLVWSIRTFEWFLPFPNPFIQQLGLEAHMIPLSLCLTLVKYALYGE